MLLVSGARAETIDVVIKDLEFVPAAIRVRTGDVVRWVNQDDFDHSASVAGGWDVPISAHKAASLKMEYTGTFHYFCRFHPNMRGTITVQD